MELQRRLVSRKRARSGALGPVQGDGPAYRRCDGPHWVHPTWQSQAQDVAVQPNGGVHVADLEDDVSDVLYNRHRPAIAFDSKVLSGATDGSAPGRHRGGGGGAPPPPPA